MAQPSATPQTWRPIASESQHASISLILEALERAFGPDYQDNHPCLSGGTAGTALFFAYLSKLPGKQALTERAMGLLEQAVEDVGKTHGAEFYSGYTGIAWTVEHMQQQVFAPAKDDEEDANGGVDEVLSDLLGRGSWRQDYDLISGLVGYGVYALERLSKPSAREVLSKVLDHLEAMAVPCAVGHSWLTPPELLPAWQRELAPKGYFNLGLAHGVPGVLMLLAAMERAGQHDAEIDSQRAKRLLEGGMSWLFGQFQLPEDGGSYLAGWHAVDQEVAEPRRNRVAWCYGDLGASLAILNAARLAGRADWASKALDLARLAAARPMETSGVMDISLCHGSAGNMVIFQRWHHLTGEACFRQAAQMYLDHLIRTREPGGPFAGYTTYKPGADEEGTTKGDANAYKPDSGLLEGAAGVGLALLSALGIEPAWDRFMMLSFPDLF